jgi:hypothetical protein
MFNLKRAFIPSIILFLAIYLLAAVAHAQDGGKSYLPIIFRHGHGHHETTTPTMSATPSTPSLPT